MATKIKYRSKKKFWLMTASFVFVVAVFGVALGLVLAATRQSFTTSINVTYTSKEVAGAVSATYQVVGGTETSMQTADGKTEIVFTGAETTTDQGGTLAPVGNQAITLTAQQREVVFKYSFTNTGDADYVASVETTNDEENLEMTISKDGENYVDIEDYSLVVFGHTTTPENYYVKFRVANVAKNADATINFKWDLESIPNDTVALLDGEPYSDITEAVVAAITDSEPQTFGVQNTADGDIPTRIITLIKDVETLGGCSLGSRKLVFRAAKDVKLTHALDEDLCHINSGSELVIGLPYDTKTLTVESSVSTIALFTGQGDITINNGVIQNNSNTAGTAIDVSGNVNFVNGTIKDFAVGIQLSDTTNLSLGGAVENCAQTFAGTGFIEIGYDYDMSNTTISSTGIRITAGNVTFTNVVFTDFPGTALDIEGGNVTLDGCTVEKAHSSAIMVDGGATVTLDGCEVKDNSVTELMTIDGMSGLAGAGLFVMGGSTVTIKDTKVENNYIEYNEYVDGANLAGSAIASFENAIVNIVGNTVITGNYISSTVVEYFYQLITSSIFNFGSILNLGLEDNDWTGVAINNYARVPEQGNCDIEISGDGTINFRSGAIGKATVNEEEYNFDENIVGMYGIINYGTLNMMGGTICGDTETLDMSLGISGESITIDSGTITNVNKAISANNTLVINDGTFTDNAGENGIITGDSITVNGGTFTGNTGTNGGVFNLYGNDNLIINGGTFTENDAVNGGVVYGESEYWYGGTYVGYHYLPNIKIYGGTFVGNTATNGGVFYGCMDSNGSYIKDAIIDGGNTVDSEVVNAEKGGAIYLVEGGLCLTGTTTIQNCKATDGGGVYIEGGTLRCSSTVSGLEYVSNTDVKIKNNTATYGGGIYQKGSIQTYNSFAISNNTATEHGGGIYWTDGTTTIGNLNVMDVHSNTAKIGGGYFIMGANTAISGSRVNVYGNTATDKASISGDGYGSGVYLCYATNFANYNIYENNGIGLYIATNATISGCSIYDNIGSGIYCNTTATIYSGTGGYQELVDIYGNKGTCGGGIMMSSNTQTLTIKGFVKIHENEATNGGGIYVSDLSTIVFDFYYGYLTSGNNTDNDFGIFSNTATENGGGIYVRGTGSNVPATIKISDTNSYTNKVFDNEAKLGGGIYMSTYSCLDVDGGFEVANNTASEHGGGIYWVGGTIDVLSNEFFNVHTNSAQVGGGMFVMGNTTANAGDGRTNIYNNTATNADGSMGMGAGVYLCYVKEISRLNVYENNGHGIFAASNGAVLHTMSIYGNTNGGIYANANTTIGGDTEDTFVEIYNHTFTGNGAGVFASDAGLTIGKYVSIHNNTATGNGGGLYTQGSLLNLNIANSSTVSGRKLGIYNNAADLGGGVYCNNTQTTHTSGAIYENTVSGTAYGGGLFVGAGIYELGADASVHSNTSGAANGGGIAVDGLGFLHVYGSVYSNTATTNGGGILGQNGASIIIYDGAKIYSNTATSYFGGGIYINGVNSTIEMQGGEIYSNRAPAGNGGGVYGINSATILLTGGEIRANTAINGGGVNIETGSISVDGVKFVGNIATAAGGGLCVKTIGDGLFTVSENVEFTGNTAVDAGAGLQFYACTNATIAGTYVGNTLTGTNNSAGGAIYIDGNNTATVSALVYGGATKETTGNTTSNAQMGGAMYVAKNSTVTFSGTVTECVASVTGGAIANMGTLTFTGTITNCRSGGGGAIVNGSTLNLKGTITGCSSTAASGIANSIATIGQINIYNSASIDSDICMAGVSSLFSGTYGSLVVKEALGDKVFAITFGDASSENMSITATGTSSNTYSHFKDKSLISGYKALITFDNASYLVLDGEVSKNFTSTSGAIKKRDSDTALYIY